MPVYLVIAGEPGPDAKVKIGFSDSVHARLSKMRSDSPNELTLYRILDGGLELEAALHARFAGQRIRGEWFAYSADMGDDLGAPDLSLVAPKSERGPGNWEWSPAQRARASLNRLSMTPEKKAAMLVKLRATLEARQPFSSLPQVITRGGGCTRLAQAIGIPTEELLGWTKIPISHLERVALAIDSPVMRLANLVERAA